MLHSPPLRQAESRLLRTSRRIYTECNGRLLPETVDWLYYIGENSVLVFPFPHYFIYFFLHFENRRYQSVMDFMIILTAEMKGARIGSVYSTENLQYIAASSFNFAEYAILSKYPVYGSNAPKTSVALLFSVLQQ